MAAQERAGARTGRQTQVSTPEPENTQEAPVTEDKPASLEDQLRELRDLVEWLRTYLSVPERFVAEQDQAERDREILSRRPNSYPEAVAREAAEKRQKLRDRVAGDRDKPAEADDTKQD